MNDSSSAPRDLTDAWASLRPLMACPDCRGALAQADAAWRCTACGTEFPSVEGIPLFTRFGSAEAWAGEKPAETSESYQQSYQQLKEAARYNAMYAERWHKRWITQREHDLLERLLSSQPRCATLLDLPCGGGRLSPQIGRHTELLIEADIGLGQVRYGREFGRAGTPQVWMTASGFHIPFRDASVDAIVCVRLNHHLPTEQERERLVRELLRVARRYVVMTFFDFDSVKNRLRRMRQPFNRKPPKMTMTVERVRELAGECGFDLVECPVLVHFGSGHRYALMVKRGG
jgi:SAM-dependent methyltransferase